MERLADASASLESATEEVVAKNRLVGAKVDATGELIELKFHTRAYRDMAPAELAAAVTDVVNRARRQMAERVSGVYSPFLPEEVDTRAAMDGRLDPREVLDRMGVSLDDLGSPPVFPSAPFPKEGDRDERTR
ncbi:YbaB/EbfC family nucleoid-associated protein [Nocardiopsis algeriensis]|uniref:YbaB/EbfC family nucleoid-associated protein n=1 Tax=Nocardiopsis algeriensis TaxID=1478215 RepID=UPI001FE8918A|nr:YbaB/EbfC family nucleoid-associated protein [Nocardiopsis algeriensis]